MSEPASQRLPANQVGLILIGLVTIWAVFIFVPRREKPAPPATSVVTESKLRAVGLADNLDWEGLPELFAIWAGHARWQDNKTAFAYWNPGTQSYSYYFEATRQNEGYRFRVVAKEELAKKGFYYYEGADDAVTNEVPELKSQTDTHPFVFLSDITFVFYSDTFQSIPVVRPGSSFGSQGAPTPTPSPAPVKVDLKSPAVPVPKPVITQDSHGPVKK